MTVTKRKRGRPKGSVVQGLTAGEKKALQAFRIAKKAAGMPPRLQDVAAVMNSSAQHVSAYLRRLVVKGKLEKVSLYNGFREPRKKAA